MKFKKLRKVYRILFPLKLSDEKLFENTLFENSVIKSFQKNLNGNYDITTIDGFKLQMRNQLHSDYLVFNQIFKDHEYKGILKALILNEAFNKLPVIIDAGANVGYTTLYLSYFLNSCKIYGIEPSITNYNVYKFNIQFLKKPDNVKIYNRALSDKEDASFVIENDFRDKKDWAVTTKEDDLGNVKGITIQQIIDENALHYISLLKIDIEGAERFIFKIKNDLSFLKITHIIAIEIHDEFNVRDIIYSILKENNFFIIESGELTIGINKDVYTFKSNLIV
jgi:FkbM family methyltransferase